jgi:hypothetical protein
MTRQCLPNGRLAETFELEVAGLRYTCTVGRFNDGRLAEVFLSNHKSNSAADTSARDLAISPLGAALDLVAVAEDRRWGATGRHNKPMAWAEGRPDAGPRTLSVSDMAASAGKKVQG